MIKVDSIWLIVTIAAVTFLAVMTFIVAAIILIRLKVRKEIGLLRTHLRYHPGRAERVLHFGEYGETSQLEDKDNEQ